MTVPEISVRNRQRKIPVNVAGLQKFAVKAVQNCLQLQKEKQTDLRKSGEISVLLISDRRICQLHRQFLGQRGPTDVLTFRHGEIFISASYSCTSSMDFCICTASTIKRQPARGK